MTTNKLFLSIITLTKNDSNKFIKTLENIASQKNVLNFEWIIIDGSNNYKQQKNNLIIKEKFKNNKNIFINHVNAKTRKISGIYPCMNYGKNIAKGKFFIFLNSGDIFFSSNTLKLVFKNILKINEKESLVFGQANIISPYKISWNFPGDSLKSIENWLKFFEPNHQAMIISNGLAKKYDFPLKYDLIADGYWKRTIIKNATFIKYIKTPLVKFYLDGISSIKPSSKSFKNIIKNKNISIIRKSIFTLKYFFPKNLFFLYHLMQKYKSNLIDFLL